MVEVNNVTKIYKLTKKQKKEMKISSKQKIAVENVSFTANEGEIFGILGTNGAGKTTTLRMIATLLKPTDGSIKVQGYDSVKDGDMVRSQISFLTSELKLDPEFTAKYQFRLFGRLRGMSEEQIDEREDELFDAFGIREFENKKIKDLSTGMKQKASIAVSLVHDPEVVIFDEPTNGLDIITARAVTDYLKVLKDKGKVVIISTHIMSDAEKLCDRLCIIIDGKSVALGATKDIIAENGSSDLEDAFFTLYKEFSGEVR